MRKTALITVVALLFAALVTGGVTAPAASAKATTRVVYVNPVAVKTHLIKKGYRITHKYSGGDCWSSDITVGAARCLSGNNLFDPCWPFRTSNSDFSGFVCLPNPWSHSLYDLVLASPTSDYGTRGHALWGFAIASGGHCSFLTGAGDSYRGHRLSWGCTNGLYGLDRPFKKNGLWYIKTVRYRKNWSIYPTGTRRVSTLYYAYGYGGS